MFWRKKTQEVEDPITTKLKNNGSIVLLDGDWGVGKTYRFQIPAIHKSRIAYLSHAFG